MNITANENFKFQRIIALVGILLFIIKIYAWYQTRSVAILTDALESTINVVAGLIGLYSLYLSALPKDHNHPYGHGKVEFISASIEGALISIAGVVIIYEAIGELQNPRTVQQLDLGLILVAFTAVVNYLLGYFAIKKGKKNNSLALIASGKHLQTDTYSTIGIIIGLIVLYITKISWIDSATALLFAGFIIYTGYQILRESISGIMDETDELLLKEVVGFLENERKTNWIDLHNLRIIKYGSTLHFDCHMTVPWYFNIEEGHKEVDALEDAVKNHFGNRIELFVHLDACKEYSCTICSKTDCAVRKHPFEGKIKWTIENVSANQKHNQKLIK
ncbi:cation transporter [Flavobacterium sp. xlx-214]|uniref:cation diffusion facilitator family transporter n=1 Tax=unclassified Flavobacterium TaxID=196869 RepID=UPI0013D825FD|nr:MULTISPECIES: cation diffusion facilitator family transporter [unclassified Flavobacterium]MBA5791652.1 cation transporter [Flavobacterium sp. xlx-221]QMI82895.1 cation transporter [Flavobacterium sp. xlx-214]